MASLKALRVVPVLAAFGGLGLLDTLASRVEAQVIATPAYGTVYTPSANRVRVPGRLFRRRLLVPTAVALPAPVTTTTTTVVSRPETVIGMPAEVIESAPAPVLVDPGVAPASSVVTETRYPSPSPYLARGRLGGRRLVNPAPVQEPIPVITYP